jgi:hypothetical protein
MSYMTGGGDPLHTSMNGNQCLGCQLVDGKIRCGISLCDSCFNSLLVMPYGGRLPDLDIPISSLHLRVPNPPSKYTELTVMYRFFVWNTGISAKQNNRSFPLLTLQGIKPMTASFLEEVGKNIDLWVLLS